MNPTHHHANVSAAEASSEPTANRPSPPLVSRKFSTSGNPYSTIEWERREARLVDHRDGSVRFSQSDVEFPASWSINATNIVAQKYFAEVDGEREFSVRQLIDRVVGVIVTAGAESGTLSDSEAPIFRDELTSILVNQRATFNSPVWFNIGVPGRRQQASACYILSVDDSIDGILDWYRREGLIFKGGSGAGANLSSIRSSRETISTGGTPSGPVSFMRGADASAGTIRSGGTTRRAAKMVVLDVGHPDIEQFVASKAAEERKARALRDAGFDVELDGADSHSLQYQNANNSVRVTDEFMRAAIGGESWPLRAVTTGDVVESVDAASLLRSIAQAAWECGDPGVQFDTTINKWHTTPSAGRINGSNPCSEYMHLDDSACNLASINLLAFLDGDGTFDVDAFEQTVRIMVIAQDILVGYSEYPTVAIGRNARAFRQLGLGYANLGALLMSLGLPYDSDDGRQWAAALTSVMSGAAYRTSSRLADRVGAFDGFDTDRTSVLNVIDMHRQAAEGRELTAPPATLATRSRQVWAEAAAGADRHGVRNAQTTVLAPTGTISFFLDCDTTGIEPFLGLVTQKKLVGGGTLAIAARTVPRALRSLGYDEETIDRIGAHIVANGSALDAPGLDPAHYPVFSCSIGDGSITAAGHIAMMAAVQPFLSGAISKTCNLPESATVDDVESLFVDAWRRGVKAVAVYRDNCKVGQPLQVAGTDTASPDIHDGASPASRQSTATPAVAAPGIPLRRRLPRARHSRTFEFRVADCKGFVTVGEYEDGRPGELFVRVSKQGSTLAGIMDAFAIAVSHGLQHGVPLRAYVDAFVGMRFEPAGMTDDPDLRFASSLMDYLFRRLALDYLTVDERQEMGIFAVAERLQPTLPGVEEAATASTSSIDLAAHRPTAEGPFRTGAPAAPVTDSSAPLCMTCGVVMQRSGSCHVCRECGTTSGCS